MKAFFDDATLAYNTLKDRESKKEYD